jgi:hypothetical protein
MRCGQQPKRRHNGDVWKGGTTRPIVATPHLPVLGGERHRTPMSASSQARSGLLALDIDRTDGEASLTDPEREFGPLPEILVNTTGRGEPGQRKVRPCRLLGFNHAQAKSPAHNKREPVRSPVPI